MPSNANLRSWTTGGGARARGARARTPRTTDPQNPMEITLAHVPGLTNPKINLLGTKIANIPAEVSNKNQNR